jgi:hypothetical protein
LSILVIIEDRPVDPLEVVASLILLTTHLLAAVEVQVALVAVPGTLDWKAVVERPT